MRLAQDDHMVHALAPDRSDQPFSEAILPRRRWCSRLVPDAHGTQSARDDGAIDSIPIANEVLRSVVSRNGVRHDDQGDSISQALAFISWKQSHYTSVELLRF